MKNELDDRFLNSFNKVRLFGAVNVMFIHTMRHMSINLLKLVSDPICFFEGVPIFYVLACCFCSNHSVCVYV